MIALILQPTYVLAQNCLTIEKAQKSITNDSIQHDHIKKKSYAISLGLTCIPVAGPLSSRMYIARYEKRDEMRKIILKGFIFSLAELYCAGLFIAAGFAVIPEAGVSENFPDADTIIGITVLSYTLNIIDTYYTVKKVNARIENKKIDVSLSSLHKSPMLCISLKF